MTYPDISLVTPAYNQGRYIEQTIQSVLAQQDVACQYIVMDGDSTDNTAAVLDRYRDRIDVIISKPDRGQADALVKGFTHARAPVMGYINSDDYLISGALRRVLLAFNRRPDVDVFYSHRIYVDGLDHFLRYWYLPPHCNYINLRWDFIPQETCFWRRSAMEAVGGIDPDLQFAMDYDLFARMMLAGCRFCRLDDFFAVFREHEDSKTVRQMDSLGMHEVELVRRRNGIRMHWYDRFVAAAYYGWLMFRSEHYRRRFPDGPQGFGARISAS